MTLLLLFLIFFGVDIFIALGAAGSVGLLLFRGPDALAFVTTSFFGQVTTFELLALPLFVLMGHVLAKSPIGGDLNTVATRWLSWLPGGLAIGSIAACTVFGAVSAVSVAGVAAIGSMAVPEMLKRGYSVKIAAGSVVTAGALAMLIPPSVPFIIYSAITGESVAKLFIGGIVPGLVLAFMLNEVLQDTGLAPRWLELELTETIALQDIDAAIATLKTLKTMGVRIAIDDFGTGYSALSYLQKFAIDYLKIDRSFIKDLTTDKQDRGLADAIVVMAHKQGLKVVAEGVEAEEQRDCLIAWGCDYAQGFYYSKPVPAGDFEALLRQSGSFH